MLLLRRSALITASPATGRAAAAIASLECIPALVGRMQRPQQLAAAAARSFSAQPTLQRQRQREQSSPDYGSSSSSSTSHPSALPHYIHQAASRAAASTPANGAAAASTVAAAAAAASPVTTTSTPAPTAAELPELSDALIASYSSKPVRSVSLQQMIDMGSNPAYLLTAAQWLWEELPVRLAKRLRDLDELPFGLSLTAEVQSLRALYRLSLAEVLACARPTTSAEELVFTDTLKRALLRHQDTAIDLASGANIAAAAAAASATLADNNNAPLTPEQKQQQLLEQQEMATSLSKQHFILQEFLDNFNSARIGSRLLMSQHVALHHNAPQKDLIGVIQRDVDPESIVHLAVADAAAVTRAALGVAPQVRVLDQSKKLVKVGTKKVLAPGQEGSATIKGFHYVPAHLRAMLFELLKIAMHATVTRARQRQAERTVPGTESIEQDPPLPVIEENEADANDATEPQPKSSSSNKNGDDSASSSRGERPLRLPAVEVVIVDGVQDVTIKVSDQGGGIRRQDLVRVFDYTFSPTRRTRAQQREQANAAERQRRLVLEAAEKAAAADAASSDCADTAAVTPCPTTMSTVAQTLQKQRKDASFLTGSNCQPVLNTAVNDFGDAFGLPACRLYARVLGGDLQLRSLAGYGTDAFLFLSKPSSNFANEQK